MFIFAALTNNHKKQMRKCMSTQKKRIADFIESVETENLCSSVVLLGGARKDPDRPMDTKNGLGCTNKSYDSCNKSTNKGDCQNSTGCCNSSTNYGKCNNAVEFSNHCSEFLNPIPCG